jgi:hypothetical protein
MLQEISANEARGGLRLELRGLTISFSSPKFSRIKHWDWEIIP